MPDHELLRRIGAGSYGEVWLARNVFGVHRAVKLVARERFDHARPFEREFSGIQKFEPISRQHDGLVDILQVGRNDDAGSFYYVMELADDANGAGDRPNGKGGAATVNSGALATPGAVSSYVPRTLATELAKRHRLSFEECLPLFLSLTSALGHVHQQGLIHRDIKPSNIIFVNGVAKLADIGLVSEAGQSDSYVGTEGYIPPEGPGSPQADLYSLGKVFYELSTGQDRTEFPRLPIGLAEWPEQQGLFELNAVFVRACANDKKDRYQSASEMQADLALLQSGKSLKRLRTMERRLVQATRMGLAAAGLLVLATTAYVLTQHQARLAQRNFVRAEGQRLRAERAEQEASDRLWSAYLAQARAGRRGGQIGHRQESLEALAKAVALRPATRVSELRHEAVAALALTELQPLRGLALATDGEVWPCFDPRLEHYLSWTAPDEPYLCRVADGQVTRRLARARLGRNWGASFSGGGRFMGLERANGSLTVWDTASGGIQLQVPPDSRLRAWEFAPDERRLLLGFGDGRLEWRDLSGRGTNWGARLNDGVRGLRLRPDGQAVAVWGDASGVLKVARSDTGEMLHAFEHPATVQCAAWSPDGGRLAVGCSDHEIWIWDLASKQRWRRLAGHASQVVALSFLGGDDLLASGSWDGSLRLWNARTGHPLLVVPDGNGRMQFDPVQQRLGVITARSAQVELRRYQVTHGDITRTLAEPRDEASSPWCAEFSPDERWLASSSYGAVRAWDVASGRELEHFSTGRDQFVGFDPCDGSLVTCSTKTLLRWPLTPASTGEVGLGPPEPLTPPGCAFRMAAIGARGTVFAARFEAGIGGFRSGTNFVHLAHSENVDALVASADGQWVAGGYWSRAVPRLWRAADGALIRELPTGGRTRVAFSPDSRWVVTCSTEEYCFWDVLTGRRGLRIAREQKPGLWGVLTFSPDGRMLALARTTMLVQLVDAATGEVLASLEHPEAQLISGLAFSPSGTQLAVATEGHLIHLWDLRQLRAKLAALNLDWNQPPWPTAAPGREPVRLRLRASPAG